MGQTSSEPLDQSNLMNDREEFSKKCKKAGLVVPLVIIAFPILNAYKFREKEFTGVKVVDGTIGGILGVVGWPLSPFMALWSAYQFVFSKEPEKNMIKEETKCKVRRAIGMNCDRYYNVAVVGAVGIGKSSIVNGILGYKNSDKNAARVHKTSKSTTEPKGYKHPDLGNVVLWDMPGTDTTFKNNHTYFENNYLYAFDSILIVISRRLQTADIEIASRAQEYHIPVLFVRNRCDKNPK